MAAAASVLLLGSIACAAGPEGATRTAGPAAAQAVPAPARPQGCRSARAGEALQPRLDALAAGEALCLEPGRYVGPVRIGPERTLWGPREAVIAASGAGTTVRLEADGARLLGVTVDGSGGRFDQLDAAVRIEGRGVRVEGVRVVNALFGILSEQADEVVIAHNEIVGAAEKPLGLRGDGIRLWETRGSRIEGNWLRDSRDLVIWYSPGNTLVGNRVERGRYGTHFMYSHGNRVENAWYADNVVGIFVMYSRNIEVVDSVLARSRGAAGVGLGCKESGNLHIRSTAFLDDTVGLYLDTCPLSFDEHNLFEGNEFRFSRAAVVLHGGERRNRFVSNRFVSNDTTLRVEGRSRAEGVEWESNYFDDYRGYDLDGDGFGDVPHEVRSLESDLLSRVPALAFFRGTPAMGAVEAVGRLVPLYVPRLLLRDPRPRMVPPRGGAVS